MIKIYICIAVLKSICICVHLKFHFYLKVGFEGDCCHISSLYSPFMRRSFVTTALFGPGDK